MEKRLFKGSMFKGEEKGEILNDGR